MMRLDEIIKWCKLHLIENYWRINNEGRVDVDYNINLYQNDFEKIPVPFGKIMGYFSVNGCKNLITLENGPTETTEWFSCEDCEKLTTLKFLPKYYPLNEQFYSYGCLLLPQSEIKIINEWNSDHSLNMRWDIVYKIIHENRQDLVKARSLNLI